MSNFWYGLFEFPVPWNDVVSSSEEFEYSWPKVNVLMVNYWDTMLWLARVICDFWHDRFFNELIVGFWWIHDGYLTCEEFTWYSMGWSIHSSGWYWLCQIWSSIRLIWQIAWLRNAIWPNRLVCYFPAMIGGRTYGYVLLHP